MRGAIEQTLVAGKTSTHVDEQWFVLFDCRTPFFVCERWRVHVAVKFRSGAAEFNLLVTPAVLLCS